MADPLFISDMKAHPHWEAHLKTLKEGYPRIAPYKPGEDNSASQWAHSSGFREGYRYALSLFHIDLIEEINGG